MMKTLFVFFLCTISVLAFAAPSLERVQQIERLADSLERSKLLENMSFVEDLNYQGLAIVRKVSGGYQVTINPRIFETLPESARNLVMFHEFGHVQLGHSDMDPKKKVREEVELEADYFSAFLYRRFEKVDAHLESFINSMSIQVSTVPSGAVRAEIFRSILLQAELIEPMALF